MKKICTALLALAVFTLTACSGDKQVNIDFSKIESGEMIENITPGMSLDEVKEQGFVFDEETQEVHDNGELSDVVIALNTKNTVIKALDYQVRDVSMQFINDKLSRIALTFSDHSTDEKLLNLLTELYGEPSTQTPMPVLQKDVWKLSYGDYPVTITMFSRLQNGFLTSGTFQVSYNFFPDLIQ